MAVTTATAVRDAMSALIKAATPSAHTQVPFRPYREDKAVSFRDYCDTNPLAATRQYTVRVVGGPSPAEGTNTTEEWNWWRFAVEMAYPLRGASFARTNLEIETVRIADALTVYKAIGTIETSATIDATVITEEQTTEESSACVFHTHLLRVGFWRSTQ